jgi:outer membrane protein TolC
MGIAADSQLQLVEPAEGTRLPTRTVTELEHAALARRSDLKRLDLQRQAQSNAVAAAKGAFGPRVNAFGSWQTDSPSVGWNGGNNWTAGLEVSLDLFEGGSKRARLARERATADRIEAAREAATDSVRLEVRSAYAELDSAQQQVEVARAAIEQAQESLRVTQNRFNAGLTTLTDLLRVEEAAHRAQTDYWDAVYRVRISFANLQLATGELSPDSLAVMQ